jgi:hypothetical protein
MYDDLSMRLPPEDTGQQRAQVAKARNYAARRGWLAPLWWDDDRIDDPTYEPRATTKANAHYRRDDLLAEWDHLRRGGVSMHAAAQQLGVTVNAIEKALERAAAADRKAS